MDVIAIAIFNDNQLRFWDIFGKAEVEIDDVIYSISNTQTEKVYLGFTPKNCNSFDATEMSGDDVLFVQKGKTKLFEENKLMFPLLSHA